MPRHGLLLALALALAGSACGSAARPAAAPPSTAAAHDPPAARKAPVAPSPRPRLLAARRHVVSLPVSSPWALPPMIVLHARASGMRPAPLRRRALRAPRLALSPSARRAVLAGRVSAGALSLLLRTPRVGTPLLVFAASQDELRVQEITLWMTRRAVRTFLDLPRGERPARLLLEPVASDRADLAGPPRPRPGQLRTLVGLYRSAGYQYGIDWKVLAAINKVETNLGRNTHRSSAGAVGWMQFLPSTWRRWGVDASGDGVADPWNPQDAVYSAARYLAAAGGSRDIRRAIFAYNHANWYVNEVLRIAASLPDRYGLGRAS
jgi:soluble lytic murein transglycosylase-like protein